LRTQGQVNDSDVMMNTVSSIAEMLGFVKFQPTSSKENFENLLLLFWTFKETNNKNNMVSGLSHSQQ
jgi:hypothetical protein